MTDKNSAKPRVHWRAAKDETVQVYSILHEAGEPMSVTEIADKMPPPYTNGACAAYAQHKKNVDPSWLVGKPDVGWPDELKREALEWFVQETLTKSKRFFELIGKRHRGMDAGLSRYAHNSDNPPRVCRTTYSKTTQIVPWTAEDNDALNESVYATMQYKQLKGKIGDRKPTPSEYAALVALADRVLFVQYQSGG